MSEQRACRLFSTHTMNIFSTAFRMPHTTTADWEWVERDQRKYIFHYNIEVSNYVSSRVVDEFARQLDYYYMHRSEGDCDYMVNSTVFCACILCVYVDDGNISENRMGDCVNSEQRKDTQNISLRWI